MRLQALTLLSSLLLTPNLTSAKKDAPRVTSTKFTHPVSDLQYFPDSDVLVFKDDLSSTIYRSADAGESWDELKDVPAGVADQLVLHPFDAKRAYVMTRKSSHWMTGDRGESWEEFFTDAEPSAYRPPLAFHASDPDKIIFNGMDCSQLFCEEMVSSSPMLAQTRLGGSMKPRACTDTL